MSCYPPQGSGGGGGSSLSGVTEDGGSPNVVTVADALNVGTATDANAAGDFAAGYAGGVRVFYDANFGAAVWYGAGGKRSLITDAGYGYSLANDLPVTWSSTVAANGQKDLQIARSAAGTLEVSDPSGSARAAIDLLNTSGAAVAQVYDTSTGSA